MADVKVDVSGQMDGGQQPQTKSTFDFSSFQKIPSPLELYSMARQNVRPWSEFLNTANFKTAASMPRLTSRFVRNLKHFQSNYVCVFFVLMVYCLITSPLILILLACVGYICHKIRKAQSTIILFGHSLTVNQQLICVIIAAIPVLFLAGAGAALFWTLGASCFVISLHAIFYNIDAVVTDENDGFSAEVV